MENIISGTFKVDVMTTSNRTRTSEEITDLIVNRLIQVADTAPPVLRDQAIEYREQIKKLINYYIKDAVAEERTACAALVEPISKEGASIILRRI